MKNVHRHIFQPVCQGVLYLLLTAHLARLATSVHFTQALYYTHDDYMNAKREDDARRHRRRDENDEDAATSAAADRSIEEEQIFDIMQAPEGKDAMDSMFQRFKEMVNSGRLPPNTQPLIFALSENFDGFKITQHGHIPFWPLFVSILNLPPHYRSKFCIGTFLMSAQCHTSGKYCDKFMLGLLKEELRLL